MRKIDAKFAKYEAEFGKQTVRGKAAIIFAVAATATVLPGGYIALEIWMFRKVCGWLRGKGMRRVAKGSGSGKEKRICKK